MSFFRRSSLFVSIFWRFFLAALAPLLGLTLITDHFFSRSLQEHIQNKLLAISDSRQTLVNTTTDSLMDFVAERGSDPVTLTAFEKLSAPFEKAGIRGKEYAALESQYRGVFQKYFNIHESLDDMLLISAQGTVFFSMRRGADLGEAIRGPALKNTILADAVGSVHAHLSPVISDFDFYPPAQGPALFVAAPVFGKEKLFGVLAVRIKPETLYQLARNYAGLPGTGEFFFVKQAGDEVVSTTPLRLRPDAAQTLRVRIGSLDAVPAQRAINGQTGAGVARDYRGKAVFARWLYIPQLRWGMVVKADVEDIFAPVRRLRRITWLFCALMALGVAWIAAAVSRMVTEPIMALQKGSEIIGRGDLDFKVGLPLDNEIGDLSRAFDRMTENLKTQTASRKALEILKADLEASNQGLEDFAYVVSHDLKAPLRGISSLSTWIETDYADRLDDEGRHQLQLIRQRAVRMDNLINGILQYSRLHRLQEEYALTDLNLLVDEVLSALDPPASIRIIRGEPLPQVSCSPTRVRQVFQNLLDNAVKHMGKETGEIKISGEDKNSHWQFCVEDDGPGIAERYFDKIFKIFNTVAPPGKTDSTGIGLALVQKAVTFHHGKVWVESKVGVGSRFFFTLPK
ncbi:MAG: ATP-binding protein [Elusimicrobia bacterium]|nr:ATP-binding protein [Elusimicrobiota bacterium]